MELDVLELDVLELDVLELDVLELGVLELDVLELGVLELGALEFVPLTAGSLDRTEKRETPRWGIGASQPGNPVGGGPIVGIPPSGRWGVFSLRSMFVKVCTKPKHLASRTQRYEASVFPMVWL